MKIAACLLLLTIYSCKHKLNNNIIIADHVALNQGPDVSLVSLIANPDKYNGKKIRVIGYLHLEFEGNGLYLHKDDYDHAISKNSIWVSIGPKHPEVSNLKQYSNHHVIMEGTYNSEMTGHMGMNSGSIEKITRLDIWEPDNWKPVKKK